METTTITIKKIDKEKWNRAKGKAAVEGISIQNLINRLISAYLQIEKAPGK